MDDKKTILLVDDEKDLVDVLKDRFELAGFNVLVAHNGEEGLKMALERHPDIILLDIVMPKKDGLSMLTDLRADSWGKDVEVVMLTNLSDSETISKALEHQTFEYFVKTSWDLDDVVEKVKARIDRKGP